MNDPALAQALFLHQSNRLPEAEHLYVQVLDRQPNDPNALHLYGLLAHQTDRLDLAIQLLTKAAQLAPGISAFHVHLASALHAMGHLDQAIQVFSRAIELDPNDAAIHRNYAVLLASAGRVEEATEHFKTVIALNPDDPEGYYNLGTAFVSRNRFKEAIEYLERAVQLQPERAENYCNLGAAYRGLWKFDQAMIHYRRALELKPDYPDALYNLGAVHHALIDVPASIECYRKCLELRPNFHIAHSSLLLSMHYLAPLDVNAIHEESKTWDRRHAQPLRDQIAPHGNDRSTNRRLRIGYVSADFFQHSVAFFVEPILQHHDKSRFEIFCYSSTAKADATTRRLHSHAEHWRHIANVPDDRVAQIVRQDQIDILVDLSGHTSHNRLLTFARKPAPIQVTYLGYPNTTGLSTMDYRLTDPIADPAVPPARANETFYVEKLISLSRTGWCYLPAEEAPAPRPPPCLENGYVTFGSFNNLTKINQQLIVLWSRLLHDIPMSRLFLKSPTLDEPEVRQRVQDGFAGSGISLDRLELSGRIISHADHLSSYHKVDIALDAFPYNGTTTTCEALWMGVPVVALSGDHHISRVGKALLTHVGVCELVASTEEEYLMLAKQLAADPDRLRQIRSTLRERMRASSLCDAEAFTRDLENVYSQIWQRHLSP